MSNWHQKLIMPGARVLDKSELCAQIRASSLAGGMPVW